MNERMNEGRKVGEMEWKGGRKEGRNVWMDRNEERSFSL